MINFYFKYIQNFNLKLLEATKSNLNTIKFIEKNILSIKKYQNKVLIFGNGGSSAISSHFSNDLINYGIKCMSFNNPQIITCISNDYGYENYITKSLELYAEKKDFVILISSSGNSANMVKAAKLLNKLNIKYATLTGFDINNKLNKISNFSIWVDSKNYNVIENIHQTILLTIFDKISKKKF